MGFEFSASDAQALVQDALGVQTPVTLEEMPKGASTRRYFRGSTSPVSAVPARSAVVLFAPDGDRPEEISDGAQTPRWPFLEVRELLERRGLRVPALLAERIDRGLLVLEDLGDVTLAVALQRAPDARSALYAAAARTLAQMHSAVMPLPGGHIVGQRLFDRELLRWELAHFVEFGLDAVGVQRSAESRRALDQAFDELAQLVADQPLGFVHRDFQSRNLMLVSPMATLQSSGGQSAPIELAILDFQDALMGPRVYDLVSLVRDSYQDLDEPFVEAVLDTYVATRGLDATTRTSLRQELDVLTVQRKLKDAGRFIFIDQRKHDPSFLPYYGPSLSRVRAALARLSRSELFGRIGELLASALPAHFA